MFNRCTLLTQRIFKWKIQGLPAVAQFSAWVTKTMGRCRPCEHRSHRRRDDRETEERKREQKQTDR